MPRFMTAALRRARQTCRQLATRCRLPELRQLTFAGLAMMVRVDRGSALVGKAIVVLLEARADLIAVRIQPCAKAKVVARAACPHP